MKIQNARARVPRRDRRGRRLHRPQRDPHQRPVPARDHRGRRARARRRLGRDPDPPADRLPRSAPARWSWPAYDVGRFATVGAGSVVTRDVPGPRARRRQPRPPPRLGVRLRPASRRRAPATASAPATPVQPDAPPAARPMTSPATPASPAETEAPMIPISKPDIGPAEEDGRPRGPPLRHARDGPEDGGVRGGVGRLLRRAPRGAHGQRHGRPGGGPPRARHRPGRRGHHGLLHLQRDGQRHPPGRRDAPSSWTSARTTSAWTRPGRGRDHAPDEGDHAGPPVRPHGRHGPAGGHRATATAS